MMPDSPLVMGILGTVRKKIYNRNDVFDATEFRTSLLKVKEKNLCFFHFLRPLQKQQCGKPNLSEINLLRKTKKINNMKPINNVMRYTI